MRLHSKSLVFLDLLLLTIGGGVFAQEPPLDVKDVQQVREACRIGCLNDKNAARRYRYLLRMGEKVFPVYEAILSDPKAIREEIGGILFLIDDTEADRHRFIKYAVSRLTDTDFGTRLNAVLLLMEIGSPTVASPIVALLSDKDIEVAYAAARTLAAIGGPNEVVAMDVWLRGVGRSKDHDIWQYVKEHRDKLKKRLDESRDLKGKLQMIQQCWRDLQITEVENRYKAHLGVMNLAAFGIETITFLKERIHPVPMESQRRLAQFLADLDSDSFDLRKAATRELSRGIVNDSVLENALANHPSLEMRRRLEAILEDLPNWESKNPELLQQVRAVWVLQQIGTPEAKALLERIAAGAPSARLTQKAKDALRSLEQLKKP